MDRAEAVSLFKELSKLFQNTEVTAIQLVEPHGGFQSGYQLRVKASLDSYTIGQIGQWCRARNIQAVLDTQEAVFDKP